MMGIPILTVEFQSLALQMSARRYTSFNRISYYAVQSSAADTHSSSDILNLSAGLTSLSARTDGMVLN